MNNHTIIYSVKDAFVLLFYRMFSFLPVSKKMRKNHLKQNNIAWESYKVRFSKDKYIEHQMVLTDIVYGNRYSADYNSCEVIAVYNALVSMGIKCNFPELLERFEHKGITWFGAFGTSPFALIKYIKSMGCDNKCYTYNKWKKVCSEDIDNNEFSETKKTYIISKYVNRYNDFINNFDSYIFMSYNNTRTIRDMIHTMCVTKDGEYYQIHNDYEGAKCYHTLKEAINGYKCGKSRMILIIGIKKCN